MTSVRNVGFISYQAPNCRIVDISNQICLSQPSLAQAYELLMMVVTIIEQKKMIADQIKL